ncbi:DinB family protein [Haliscomenobacter sp.]|uniref:DinB family protein n=1 Tax=Haliscomenobacter sp. TaxID=2717303 RepID=UPI00359456EA
MNKQEIIQRLHTQYGQFCELVQNLSPEAFIFHREGKWSAAQQLDHLIRSVRPVVLGLSLPSFLLRLIFGRAKHASQDYDTLVKTYQAALANGGKSPKAYEPKVPGEGFQSYGAEKLMQMIAGLDRLLDSLSESELDTLQAPHPLLGKLTLRELMYFTIYHAQHHQRNVEMGLA